MTVEQVFDSLAVRMKQEELGGLTTCINWNFTDTKELWIMGISNRTLYYTPGRQSDNADATVTLARTTLIDVVTQSTSKRATSLLLAMVVHFLQCSATSIFLKWVLQ
jgi:alkyl sulfatase BDS1-like metallo-beta-lactamase superfamily hydrolase